MKLNLILFILNFDAVTSIPGPRCKTNFQISWLSKPPYLYQGERQMAGILPGILKHMIDECCQMSINLTYELIQPGNGEDVSKYILNGTSDFVLPLAADEKATTFLTLPYLPMVESPGMAFYSAAKLSTGEMIAKAIKASSPLVILVAVFVVIVGTLFWIFERTDESFNFIKIVNGICEGIWWSFVTMTTVGYGDVYPKTSAGRALCLIWTILGLLITSVFTATVTAILTSICLSESITLQGNEVAVLQGSEEYNIAVKRNAIPITFRSIEEIAFALEHKTPSASLIDSYVAGHHQEKFKKFRLQKIVENVFSYGVVLRPSVIRYQRCFKDYLQSRQGFVYEHVAKSIKPLKRTKTTSVAEEKSKGILDVGSPTLYFPMAVSFGLLVFLSFFGVTRELILARKDSCRTSSDPHAKKDFMEIRRKHENEVKKILADMHEAAEFLPRNCVNAMSKIDRMRSRNTAVKHETTV